MFANDAKAKGYFEDPGIGFGAAQPQVNGGYDNFGAFGGGMPPVSSFLGGMPQQQASAGRLDWDAPGVGQVGGGGGGGGLWSGEGAAGGFARDMHSSSAFGGQQQQQQQQGNFEVDQDVASFLPYGDYM
jgi:hypothetical protein